LLVHGGAGTFERLGHGGARQRMETRSRLEEALRSALARGWDVLGQGGAALPAAVEAVASLEDSSLFNAGRGSSLTTDGQVETDASVMDGATLLAGAVCAATWPANPIRAALAVANLALTDPTGALTGPAGHGRGWQPLLLAGAGADQLARASGLAPMGSPGGAGLVAPAGGHPHDQSGHAHEQDNPHGQNSHGTVGAVALDAEAHVAAATSTGGRPGQPAGRVGDSSIIGAGTWADDATLAVSATGAGEAFILAGFAHRVDWAMRSKLDLDEALAAALDAVSLYDGSGGTIALTPTGRFGAIFGTAAMARGWRSATELVVRI
jgi:L-asparaginase / beta-aspartyl-peptidase